MFWYVRLQASEYSVAIYLSLYSFLLSEIIKEKEHMLNVSYVNAIESIMYAMFYTHSDISHVVSVVNKFMRNLGKVNYRPWNAYYLRGTKDIGLYMT